MALVISDTWTAAALNLEVSYDRVSWITAVYDSSQVLTGSVATPVASAAYALDIAALLPFRFIRIRSGTSATPVNQAADRTIMLISRPLA
jgi:hypothetical protein